MSFYDVVPTSVLYVKPLAVHLRPAACSTLRAFGLDPRASLRRAFVASNECWTALLNGRPEAMWGVHGAALSDHAVVWAALSDTAVRFPLAIVRRARTELARIAATGRTLYATVGKDDERAYLFAKTVGFTVENSDDPHMTLMRYGWE